ncbi:MAG: trehalose synthase [Herpetosiphonaceae bacterium]|nr:MAG: trehalose synthase [Herpetosiphonaceae bacterium]
MPKRSDDFLLEDDPLWYKDAIIYELHVRAFYDSNGDGIGDFRGLTEKLDYLSDLGVTAIWLLPFYPSPLKDDGYDIADYTTVHPNYGTLADVRQFVREAHRRGLRVITELVCNHTSDQHAWFQRARRAKPGSSARNFYVWSNTPEKYKEVRIIFKDFETSNWAWDHVAQAYYWHRFFSHQPDLNYDNPQVQRAVFRVMDFWLAMGIDGLRLDAIPYLYEREGTSCENLPETHAYLKLLRRHIDERFKNRMLLAEANQWPEDAVAYFGAGDECHMSFHFPLMPRLFMAIHMEDRYPILDILAQTPAIPETAQWALFLRNHDELTLEMVTDEERDYMYRFYAHDPRMRINLGIRRRLAPLLGNNRRRIELMNGLLFSLPGTPVIYYGDEIGMGDNIYLGDRNGVRTPMQWTPDRNAGFSAANRQQLYLPVIVDPEYHYEAVNVASQQSNPHSLLWWMKRLIALRKRYKAFGRGTIEFLHPDNRKVLAFIRRYDDQHILVVANLSRFVQACELDLSAFHGMLPVEMFGRIEFPAISDRPYFLTLGPHAFYWFLLEPQRVEQIEVSTPQTAVPVLATNGTWDTLIQGKRRVALEDVLPRYLQGRRWFGGKARRIKSTEIRESIPIPFDGGLAYVTFVHVEYSEGSPETYLLPLACASGEQAEQIWGRTPQSVVARMRGNNGEALLYDALWNPDFSSVLLQAISRRRQFEGEQGLIISAQTRAFRQLRGSTQEPIEPTLGKAEQSNTSVIFGDRLIMKVFRRLDEGLNPDLEIGRFLTEGRRFAHTAPVAGSLEYQRKKGAPISLAILHGYVPNQGDAWQYTLDTLRIYFDRILAYTTETVPIEPLLDLFDSEIPQQAFELIGPYLSSAQLLGERTAQMHLALASHQDDPNFAPEPFTPFYLRSVFQSMRGQAARAFQALQKAIQRAGEDSPLSGRVLEEARRLLDMQDNVISRFRGIIEHKIEATRIRIHGDYHLGQVLYTGQDFVIIDFEGEPARSLQERRLKRSPLRDVAGMLRSFHYAAFSALYEELDAGGVRKDLEPWARYWHTWVSTVFLQEYLRVAGNASFLPQQREVLKVMLRAYVLEKAAYELLYELNNRPGWVRIPILGMLQLLEEE